MQDELGIAWAEGEKLWKLEIWRNFTAYRNLFQEMPQSLVMQPYPDIVNTIICFFLWAHASNHLISAWMWVCVSEREVGGVLFHLCCLSEHLEELKSVIFNPVPNKHLCVFLKAFSDWLLYIFFTFFRYSLNYQEFQWLFIGLQLKGFKHDTPIPWSPQIIPR